MLRSVYLLLPVAELTEGERLGRQRQCELRPRGGSVRSMECTIGPWPMIKRTMLVK